jgi:hypothetical protein
MSHVEKMDNSFRNSPEGIEEAKLCAKLMGAEFIENKKTYVWYGRHVGDYPLPQGFKPKDLGKCEHVLRFPGARYEVGLVKDPLNPDRLVPLYDFYERALKDKIGGEKAPLLKQAMVEATTTLECKRRGHVVERIKLPDGGVRLVVAEKKEVARKSISWKRVLKKLLN